MPLKQFCILPYIHTARNLLKLFQRRAGTFMYAVPVKSSCMAVLPLLDDLIHLHCPLISAILNIERPVRSRFFEHGNILLNLGHRKSEEHTSELQSQFHLVCRLLLEKKG